MSTRKKSPFIFRALFRTILIVCGVAMLLSYSAVYINPAKFNIPLFFGLYFIPILAINVFLLIIALIRRSASAWIPFFALIPSLLYAERFYNLGFDEQIEREGIKLKIESCNVGMFSGAKGKQERNLSKEGERVWTKKNFYSHFKDINPDIICLQEFLVESPLEADTIFSQYKYRTHHLFRIRNNKYFGNIILSKFPIKNSGYISFKHSTNLSIYADINHYGRDVRIYNNHLESYNVSFSSLIQKFSETKDLTTTQIKNDIVETHEKMLGTFIKRTDQVDQILTTISNTSIPSIICGDFNDTPMSYTYNRLCKDREDSFIEGGKGFGATFAPMWPLLRIDYILYPSEYECADHITHKMNLSDHYPVSATIII